jgi:spore coat protein H
MNRKTSAWTAGHPTTGVGSIVAGRAMPALGACRRHRHRLLAVVFLLLLAGSADAQTADELFQVGTVTDLQLFVNTRDLELLRENYRENAYYQADFDWRGTRVRNVAIRSRGNGSRSPVKLGLEVDFNRYVSGQRFAGLEQLVLDNLVQDPGLIRERLAMALFARLGQPAPRETFARVFINGAYEGLYAIVEAVDEQFLARNFGTSAGNLFEYRWVDPFYAQYLGDALEPYKLRFEAENHLSQGDVALYTPLHDLFREAGGDPDAVWRQNIERYLDVPQFLTHVATEKFLSEADGILGFWGMNNFYVHRAAGTTQHQFIPWDRDHAFQEADASIFLRGEENVLFRQLMTYPDLRAMYLKALSACARAATEDDWLQREVIATASLVRDAVYQDVHKPYSNERFEEEVAFLEGFARIRSTNVLAAIMQQ